MNPWRWLFGAKVRVLRLRPGDVVVLEATRPTTPAYLEAVRDQWADRLPDVPVVVTDGLRLGGVVRSEAYDPTQVPPTPPGPRVPQTPNPTRPTKRGAM